MLKHSVWQKAKKITGYFEGGSVTGNFDGQGVSMGLLQWNLGQGMLQPILKEFFATYPALTQQWGLTELQAAVSSNTALTFSKQTMNGGGKSLVKPWKTRLTTLNNSAEFQSIADKYCSYYINTATNLCNSYGIKTDRAFCLFFDIAVQMGSLPVIELAETAYLDKLNAIALYAASRANRQWQSDVQKRKQAIVYGKDMGRGWCGANFTDTNAFAERVNIVDANSALNYLKEQEVISDTAYWAKVAETTKNFDALLIKMANRLQEEILK